MSPTRRRASPGSRSEDVAWRVGGGFGVALGEPVDLRDDAVDLVHGRTGEGERLADDADDLLFGQSEPAVLAEAPEQVVLRQSLAQVQRRGDRVLLDHLVRGLPADAV